MYSSQYWPFIRCACSGWPITRKFNRFKTTTMNYMITGDNGESKYSPYYQGDRCIHCGRPADTNEAGECERCETSECFLCAEKKHNSELRTVLNKDVCTECIDYEGIDAVRDLIRRHNQKVERGLRMAAENEVSRLQNIIKENCKVVVI